MFAIAMLVTMKRENVARGQHEHRSAYIVHHILRFQLTFQRFFSISVSIRNCFSLYSMLFIVLMTVVWSVLECLTLENFFFPHLDVTRTNEFKMCFLLDVITGAYLDKLKKWIQRNLSFLGNFPILCYGKARLLLQD